MKASGGKSKVKWLYGSFYTTLTRWSLKRSAGRRTSLNPEQFDRCYGEPAELLTVTPVEGACPEFVEG
ncbi:MAG TPA: hypothetical protein PLH74_08285 [Tenuifilaceae bacterium]|nr:hypothetical protein [Tenuifilaceae bacterium]